MDPVSFATVKGLLDKAVDGWREQNGGDPDLSVHSDSFGWATKAELLAAEAFGRQLVAPDLVGNGRGRDTALAVALASGVPPFGRMPSGGPFLSDGDTATVVAWIDAGTPD